MDEFVRMVRVFIEKEPDKNEKLPQAWKELANAPLKAIVMAVYDHSCTGCYNDVNGEYEMDEYYSENIARCSKDVVKNKILAPWDKKCPRQRALDKFQNDFDDDISLSKVQKAKVARMIMGIMSNLKHSDDPTDNYCVDDLRYYLRPFEMNQLYANDNM
jgi:hypothetical protein